MKPETISLLCAPDTHEALSLISGPSVDGIDHEYLLGKDTGKRFDVRDGIPCLLDETKISGFNQQYQGFYNRTAGGYDLAIKLFALVVRGGEGKYRKEFLDMLEIRAGYRVLEVSVGTGANLQYLPESAAYYGVDLSWGMLKKCQSNLRNWQREAELVLGNAEELPLIDSAFDSVLHVGGINAFNDQAKAIQEMVRVAKPGAKIVIADETAKLMKSFAWVPSARRWLQEHSARLSAPVGLVPEGMANIEVKEITRGNMYCLCFRKP